MTHPIFTNYALTKMKIFGLSESQVLDAFNKGIVEKKGGGYNAIKKYSTYEVGVYYTVKSNIYKIVSVWKRNRR